MSNLCQGFFVYFLFFFTYTKIMVIKANKVKHKQKTKRKELAFKALPIIDAHGFGALSVSDICAALGISVGTFYHYFKDKNDIIMEFFHLIDQYYIEKVEPEIKLQENTLDGIRFFCLQYGVYSIDVGLEICRQISVIPMISQHDEFMSDKRVLCKMLFEIVERGQATGQITTRYTAKQVVDMFLIMIRGYCFDWVKCNAAYDIVEAIGLHCDILLDHFRAKQSYE